MNDPVRRRSRVISFGKRFIFGKISFSENVHLEIHRTGRLEKRDQETSDWSFENPNSEFRDPRRFSVNQQYNRHQVEVNRLLVD
jgi:hypothetical protein